MSASSSATTSVGFLLAKSTNIQQAPIMASAKAMGLELVPIGESGFRLGEVVLMIMGVDMPHPDAPTMSVGLMSPSAEEATAAPAHLIVSIMGLPEAADAREALQTRLLAAVVKGTEAIGVMFGSGVMFYRPEVYTAIVEGAPEGAVPVEVCVDITFARQPDGQFSLLTHGLQRFGREEFLITTTNPREGFDFALMMSRWMIADPSKVLPTGDTIGRTVEEKITIRRTASPIEGQPEVVWLEV